MEALGCSASGVLNELVARMPVNDDGLPLWDDSGTAIAVQPALIDVAPEPARPSTDTKGSSSKRNKKLAA
jgi:hypothetical protein